MLDSLNNLNSSDFEKLNAIRRYLAAHLDAGQAKDSLDFSYHKIPWDSFPPFHCLELFTQNQLTARCGLTSYILARLYAYAGYKNYIYDCGFPGTRFTHQFNLVPLDNKLVLQDAYYNITVADSALQPKDFLQLLTEIKNEDFSNIRILRDTALIEFWKDTLSAMDSSILSHSHSTRFIEENVKEIKVVDNRYRVLVLRYFDSSVQTILARKPNPFKDENIESYLSLYLLPILILDGSTGLEADSIKQQVMPIVQSYLDSVQNEKKTIYW